MVLRLCLLSWHITLLRVLLSLCKYRFYLFPQDFGHVSASHLLFVDGERIYDRLGTGQLHIDAVSDHHLFVEAQI